MHAFTTLLCIFKELSLFTTNKVSSSKTQGSTVNKCINASESTSLGRICQRSFNMASFVLKKILVALAIQGVSCYYVLKPHIPLRYRICDHLFAQHFLRTTRETCTYFLLVQQHFIFFPSFQTFSFKFAFKNYVLKQDGSKLCPT